MKNLAFLLNTWSFFALAALLVLLKALEHGQRWRMAAAGTSLAIALVFVTLLLLHAKKQRPAA